MIWFSKQQAKRERALMRQAWDEGVQAAQDGDEDGCNITLLAGPNPYSDDPPEEDEEP